MKNQIISDTLQKNINKLVADIKIKEIELIKVTHSFCLLYISKNKIVDYKTFNQKQSEVIDIEELRFQLNNILNKQRKPKSKLKSLNDLEQQFEHIKRSQWINYNNFIKNLGDLYVE